MKPTGILRGVPIAPERLNILVTASGEGSSEAGLFRLAPSISTWVDPEMRVRVQKAGFEAAA